MFPKREQHAIPSMDGALSPNDRLDACQPDRRAYSRRRRCGRGTRRRALCFRRQARYCVCPARAIGRARPLPSFEANAGGLAISSGWPASGLRFRPWPRCRRSLGASRSWLNQVGDQPLNCPTSVVAAPDGSIFVTNGSSANLPEDWCADLMQKNSLGRLDQLRAGARSADGFVARPRLSPWAGHCARPKDALVYAELESLAEPRFRCRATAIGPVSTVNGNLPGYPARLAKARPQRLLAQLLCRAHASRRVRAARGRFPRGDDGNHRTSLLGRTRIASGEDCHEPMQWGWPQGARHPEAVGPAAFLRSGRAYQ